MVDLVTGDSGPVIFFRKDFEAFADQVKSNEWSEIDPERAEELLSKRIIPELN